MAPAAAAAAAAAAPVARRRKRRWSRAELQRAAEKQEDDSRIYNLTLDVNALREDIRRASQRTEAATLRARAVKDALERDATDLSTRFARLLVLRTESTPRIASRPTLLPPVSLLAVEDAAFVATRIGEQLMVGSDAVGRGELLERCQAVARLLHVRSSVVTDTRVLLPAPNSPSQATGEPVHTVVECRIKLVGRLTRQALETVFPNTCNHPELSSEILRHLSKRLRCQLRATFFVDPASGVAVAADLELDLIETLTVALPSAGLLGATTLLSAARLDVGGMPDHNLVHQLIDSPHEVSVPSRFEHHEGLKLQDSPTSPLSLSPLSISSPSHRHSLEFILSPTA